MIKTLWNKYDTYVYGVLLLVALLVTGIKWDDLKQGDILNNREKRKQECFKLIENITGDEVVPSRCSKFMIEYHKILHGGDYE